MYTPHCVVSSTAAFALLAWCSSWAHPGKVGSVGPSQPCVCVRQSFSLAVVSGSCLLGPVGALLQHQHSFPMLLKSHRISFDILKDKGKNRRGWWAGQIAYLLYLCIWIYGAQRHRPAVFVRSHEAFTWPWGTCGNKLHRHTLRMRMKSCLSTRRKWQLSSLKMMVAARGASFSKASCPKSSPSCSVVTRPCVHTVLSALHYTSIRL